VNPVFSGSPNQIPSLEFLSLDTPDEPELGESSKSIAETFSEIAGKQLKSLIGQLSTFSVRQQLNHEAIIMDLLKNSLARARVLGQYESKYVLCTMDWSSLSVTLPDQLQITALVAVEQHAADERVRVERLMKEMCVCSYEPTSAPMPSFDDPVDEPEESATHRVDNMVMIPPLPITLSRLEWNTARLYSDWLYRWGIVLNTSPVYRNPAHTRGTRDTNHREDTTVSRHFTETLSDSNEDTDTSGMLVDHQEEHAASRAESVPANGPTAESDYVQCWITSLPRAVADRCVVEEDLTLNLIKDTISLAEEIQYGESHVLPGIMGISDGKSARAGIAFQCQRAHCCTLLLF
jgi:hypothetical protein